jgi:hypothetical protein
MNNGFQASCEIRGDGLNKKCLNLNEDRVGGWVGGRFESATWRP